MIPDSILNYLDQHGVRYERHVHPRAVSAQRLAQAVHLPGDQVCKSVICEVDGRRCIAVLPATEQLDESRLAEALNGQRARLVSESEFERSFPDCEVGAEPPFGGLYNLPVICDSALSRQERICCRAGSHEECVVMSFRDFQRLEQPIVADVGVRTDFIAARQARELRV